MKTRPVVALEYRVKSVKGHGGIESKLPHLRRRYRHFEDRTFLRGFLCQPRARWIRFHRNINRYAAVRVRAIGDDLQQFIVGQVVRWLAWIRFRPPKLAAVDRVLDRAAAHRNQHGHDMGDRRILDDDAIELRADRLVPLRAPPFPEQLGGLVNMVDDLFPLCVRCQVLVHAPPAGEGVVVRRRRPDGECAAVLQSELRAVRQKQDRCFVDRRAGFCEAIYDCFRVKQLIVFGCADFQP